MNWLFIIVASFTALFIFSGGFIAGSIRTLNKLHGVGCICISKEGDPYLELPSENALDELKGGDFAMFTILREDNIAENAPSIME